MKILKSLSPLVFVAFSAFERNARVSMGGRPASVGEFPYQASIRTLGNEHRCSGVIINYRWILTSAVCVYNQAPNSLSVVVGTVFLNSGGTAYISSSVVTHPQFIFQLYVNEWVFQYFLDIKF